MKKRIHSFLIFSAAVCFLLISACQKKERPELSADYPKDPPNPGGTLKFYTAFEGTEVDSMRANFGTPKNVTYATGINGKALKGGTGVYIEYPSANEASKTMTSFSVSFWMNTTKHDGGAQNVFMIPRKNDFWGNMFCLIEGGPTSNQRGDSMLIKFHFAGNWVELLNNNRLPNMFGSWKHLVFTYDAGTSKFNVYLDGAKRNLPASITDRTKNGAPLGSNFEFIEAEKFIIGGFQQNLGSPWNAPETWMLNFGGLLDQFRIYSKALNDAEVNELYIGKK
jgi:hypothetical protein